MRSPLPLLLASSVLLSNQAVASSFHFGPDGSIVVEAKPETPMSLTAADGTGLTLKALDAKGVVEDPLAFTELHLTFTNPRDRIVEGQFKITLPPGAMVSRFAMKLGDQWQEGEVVERQAARRAYEDFLHRRQDPALLEQGAGNEFTARVFPIPANGEKELIVSYSQELAGNAYALPLRGLPKLGELSVHVDVPGGKGADLTKTDWVPDQDFAVANARLPGRLGLRHGDMVVARVTGLSGATAPEEIHSLLVLFDTSASRALGFDDQVVLLQRLVSGLAAGAGPSTPLTVAMFDQTVEPVYHGPVSGFGDAQVKQIKDWRALGASDLEGALVWAAGDLGKNPRTRVLVIGDGVATAGAVDADKLGEKAKKLKAVGVERLDAIAVGGIRDEVAFKHLTTAGLPHDGVVADGKLPMQTIAQKLTLATRSGVAVEVAGASWSWPRTLDGVQAGDETLVYATVPAETPVKLTVAGSAVSLPEESLARVEGALLERAHASARIASIQDQIDRTTADAAREKLKKSMVDLSTQYRVLCPLTGLLVLETEQDYARFGINRNALADILTVDHGALSLMHRSGTSLAFAPKPVETTRSFDRAKGGKKAKEGDSAMTKAERFVPGKDDEMQEKAPMSPASGEGQGYASGLVGHASGGGGAMAQAVGAPRPVARMQTRAVASAPPPADALPMLDRNMSAGEAVPAATMSSISEERAPNGPMLNDDHWDERHQIVPFTGIFKEVMDLLANGSAKKAVAKAREWHQQDPGDVMALTAMGQALEFEGDLRQAARAYGSVIDLFPARADLRRFAGNRLEHLKGDAGMTLALDTYRKAAEERPDHPASHRLLAYTLLKMGHPEKAFNAMVTGVHQTYPTDRFAGVDQILHEDLGLIAAAWIKAEPSRREEILSKLKANNGIVEDQPSIRFVLNWETDANDVDFHILDAQGNHAFYSQPHLASGGDLYADVTTGYGPECFTIRKPVTERAYPYRLQAHYYSRGPMGYGMGKIQILEHDGKGGLRFEERPFVVQVDQAFVDMGTVTRPSGT